MLAGGLGGQSTDTPRQERGSVNRPRPVKRSRRTRADIAALDDAVIAAVDQDAPVSLRGVYYRAVSMGACAKTDSDYKAVGRELLKLRRAGVIDYTDIVDGTRLTRKPASYRGVKDALDAAAASYRRDLWEHQRTQVIVLSEKDAISGVVYPVTAEWDVELALARGYSSETFTYSIAQSVAANADADKETVVYQLGDHDPSGVDAWRSFQERVVGFLQPHGLHLYVSFERLAVTPEQIEMWNLPTRPAKKGDSRMAAFGDGGCVEVDAIPASELRRIVDAAIEQWIDPHDLEVMRVAEISERVILERIAGVTR